MGLSIRQLFAGATVEGPVPWKTVPASDFCTGGVYVVAVTDDPDWQTGIAWTGCDRGALKRWIEHLQGAIKVDGRKATPEMLERRLAEFWFESEPVVYVGQTKKFLRKRICQLYTHQIGRRSPHRGGHWLHALSNLERLWLFWAAVPHPERIESRMLRDFQRTVRSSSLLNACDLRLELGLPFANIELAKGKLKPHGLQRQAC